MPEDYAVTMPNYAVTMEEDYALVGFTMEEYYAVMDRDGYNI